MMKLRYRIGTKVINYLWTILFGFQVEGRENILENIGLIIAPNHLSNFDPPLVGTAAWNRECYFLSKTSVFFSSKFATFIMKAFNAYPINIEKPEKTTFDYTKDLLRRNFAIIMFPEGTRSKVGHLNEFNEGVAWMAFQFNVPIIPVLVVNTNTPLIAQMFRKTRVLIKLGKPIPTDFYRQFKNSKEARKIITQEIKSRIEEMGRELNR
jgi:1-acyl-sn-glycerol-3-phosphate acyltransferase